MRLTGVVMYAATVAWCRYQLPTSPPFVVPGAVLGGGVRHVWKACPWLGLAVFTHLGVVVPLLLWPSMGTGWFADLTDGRPRPACNAESWMLSALPAVH